MTAEKVWFTRAAPTAWLGLLLACGAVACTETPEGASSSTSLYALVQGIDGVYFYPPLGPEPSPSGTFEATLLDGLTVAIEAEDASGTTVLGAFGATTDPAVRLLPEQQRYWVNIPAAAYVTDPAKTYRIRVALDGTELGASTLSARIFEVMRWNPALPIGVHVRIEGSGAVRAVPRTRAGGAHGTPRHCSDGVRNKDETGVDCGGGCAPCCVPSPEVCDGRDNDCDGVVDNGDVCLCADYHELAWNPRDAERGGYDCRSPALGATCYPPPGQETATFVAGHYCAHNGSQCYPDHYWCKCQAVQCCVPSAEVCDGFDNDCDGQRDEGNPGGGVACSTGLPGACAAGTTSCSAGQLVCVQSALPSAEVCDGVDNDCDGQVDEGNPGGGATCATGLVGACAAGTMTCSGGHVSCTPNVSPSPEVCDGIDNDCDGLVDDGVVCSANLASFAGYRAWSDGTYAASCNAYRLGDAAHAYAGATGDGTYRIDVPGLGRVDVTCDMTTDGGGWTGVAEFSSYVSTTPGLFPQTGSRNFLGTAYFPGTHDLLWTVHDSANRYGYAAYGATIASGGTIAVTTASRVLFDARVVTNALLDPNWIRVLGGNVFAISINESVFGIPLLQTCGQGNPLIQMANYEQALIWQRSAGTPPNLTYRCGPPYPIHEVVRAFVR